MVVRRLNLEVACCVALGCLSRLAWRVELWSFDVRTWSGRPVAVDVSLGYLLRSEATFSRFTTADRLSGGRDTDSRTAGAILGRIVEMSGAEWTAAPHSRLIATRDVAVARVNTCGTLPSHYRLGEAAVSEYYPRASPSAPQATWGGSSLLQSTTYLPGHLRGGLLSKER